MRKRIFGWLKVHRVLGTSNGAGVFALGTIPAANGVINGCYNNKTGALSGAAVTDFKEERE